MIVRCPVTTGRRHHAGRDGQRGFVGAQMVLVGADLDLEENMALLVGDAVGADAHQMPVQRAVALWIIGTDFNAYRLAGLQERDVAGQNAGDDLELAVHRHDLDQLLRRLDDAADGFYGDVVDDAVYRGI